MKPDAVIVSVNDRPEYYQYVGLCIAAWERVGIQPVLIVVKDDEWSALPKQNRAQIARIRAYPDVSEEYGDLMVGDIDLIPLGPDAFHALPTRYHGILTAFGYDAYVHLHEGARRFPGCYMVADATTWARLIPQAIRALGPESTEADIVKVFGCTSTTTTYMPDLLHDAQARRAHPSHRQFCEERLMFGLLWAAGHAVSINRVARGWDTLGMGGDGPIVRARQRLDRINWPSNEAMRMHLHKPVKMIDAHMPRPMRYHIEAVRPIYDHIGIQCKPTTWEEVINHYEPTYSP